MFEEFNINRQLTAKDLYEDADVMINGKRRPLADLQPGQPWESCGANLEEWDLSLIDRTDPVVVDILKRAGTLPQGANADDQKSWILDRVKIGKHIEWLLANEFLDKVYGESHEGFDRIPAISEDSIIFKAIIAYNLMHSDSYAALMPSGWVFIFDWNAIENAGYTSKTEIELFDFEDLFQERKPRASLFWISQKTGINKDEISKSIQSFNSLSLKNADALARYIGFENAGDAQTYINQRNEARNHHPKKSLGGRHLGNEEQIMKKFAVADWHGNETYGFYNTKEEAFEAAEDLWSRLTREEKNRYLKDKTGVFNLFVSEFRTESKDFDEMYHDLYDESYGMALRNFVISKYDFDYFKVKDLGNAAKAKESDVKYLLQAKDDDLKDLIEYDDDSYEIVKGIEWLNALCEIERRLDAGEYDSDYWMAQDLYDLLNSRKIVCEPKEEE